MEYSQYSQLNTEQLQVWKMFDDYFQQLATSKITGPQRPKPPRVFVHGGTGIGKTFFINVIHESMKNMVSHRLHAHSLE